MQWIALITMLIDHVGIVFFPEETIWRWIGRLSFPLYAYGIVNGLRYTRSRSAYVKRLVWIGAAAQVPYMLAFDTWQVNVIGTFLVVIAVIWVLERYPERLIIQLLTIALAFLLLDAGNFDYGSYALFLILIYRYVSMQWIVVAHFGLNLVYMFYQNWVIQLASVFSTCLLVYGQPLLDVINRLRMPRWLWWSFYPAHLLVLYMVHLMISNV